MLTFVTSATLTFDETTHVLRANVEKIDTIQLQNGTILSKAYNVVTDLDLSVLVGP